MNKEWCKLSIYIYNTEAINDVLKKLTDEINRSEKLKHQVMISKKWQLGPHVQMIYSLNEETKAIVNKIIENLRQYLALNEIEITQTYEKYEELSKWIAQLEEYKGDILPLKKHLDITNEKMDLNDISTIFPLEVYVEIEKLLSAFVCDAYGYFYNMDKKSQDSFLAKCMIILGNQQEENDFAKGGVKYGYMTFQSHYYGFVSQINQNNPSEMRIYEELQRLDTSITDELVNEMMIITDQNLDNADNQTEELELLAKWQKTVIGMLKIYDEMLSNNNISWNDNHKMNTFIKRNENHLSEFHSNLQQSDSYMEFLNSRFFKKHRLTINAFYTILPLFSVSPLRKHKLCKYVADSVERYFNQDYASVMKTINQNYQKVASN